MISMMCDQRSGGKRLKKNEKKHEIRGRNGVENIVNNIYTFFACNKVFFLQPMKALLASAKGMTAKHD